MRALLGLLAVAGLAFGGLYFAGDRLSKRAAVRAADEGPVAAEDADADTSVLGWVGSAVGAVRADEPEAPPKTVYYQYVDDAGSVNLVSSLEDVPLAWRERAGRIEVERGPVAATSGGFGSPASGDPSERAFAYEPDPVVVVYTTSWCGWCRKTLAFLDQKGVRYENRDIEANASHRRELVEKTGRTSIPVVEIDGELIRGYDPARMERLL